MHTEEHQKLLWMTALEKAGSIDQKLGDAVLNSQEHEIGNEEDDHPDPAGGDTVGPLPGKGINKVEGKDNVHKRENNGLEQKPANNLNSEQEIPGYSREEKAADW